MKVTLRLNILYFLLIVIIVITFSLIGISYFALDSTLIKSAKKSLSLGAGKASEQLGRYLQPLSDRTQITASLISSGTITPNANASFANYLYDFIADEPSIDAAYYADNSGNFYLLQKTQDHGFINRNIVQTNGNGKNIVNIYSPKMELTNTSESPGAFIEPQKQIWYTESLNKKHNIWFTFPLIHQGPGYTELGIASVIPVFDKAGNALGVFGIDTILSTLSPYIKNIDTSANSIVLIVDDLGRVMSAVSAKMDLVAGNRMRTVAELNIPWVQTSFNIFSQTHQDSFSFAVKNKRYFAVFEKVPNIKSEHQWFVAVVSPNDDIKLPLRMAILMSLIAVSGIVVIVLVTWKSKDPT